MVDVVPITHAMAPKVSMPVAAPASPGDGSAVAYFAAYRTSLLALVACKLHYAALGWTGPWRGGCW